MISSETNSNDDYHWITQGAEVDILDAVNEIYCPGTIIDMKNKNKVIVHYKGWESNWDEVLNKHDARIQPPMKYVLKVKAWVKFETKLCYWPCVVYIRQPKEGSKIGKQYLKSEKKVYLEPYGLLQAPLRPYKHGVWINNKLIKPFNCRNQENFIEEGLAQSNHKEHFMRALADAISDINVIEYSFNFDGTYDYKSDKFKSPVKPALLQGKKRKRDDEEDIKKEKKIDIPSIAKQSVLSYFTTLLSRQSANSDDIFDCNFKSNLQQVLQSELRCLSSSKCDVMQPKYPTFLLAKNTSTSSVNTSSHYSPIPVIHSEKNRESRKKSQSVKNMSLPRVTDKEPSLNEYKDQSLNEKLPWYMKRELKIVVAESVTYFQMKNFQQQYKSLSTTKLNHSSSQTLSNNVKPHTTTCTSTVTKTQSPTHKPDNKKHGMRKSSILASPSKQSNKHSVMTEHGASRDIAHTTKNQKLPQSISKSHYKNQSSVNTSNSGCVNECFEGIELLRTYSKRKQMKPRRLDLPNNIPRLC